MALIVKRKRMMDSVGHYARPELLSLLWDDRPAATLHSSNPTSLSRSGGQSDETDGSSDGDADRTADQRVAVLRGSSR
jgi:nitrilase